MPRGFELVEVGALGLAQVSCAFALGIVSITPSLAEAASDLRIIVALASALAVAALLVSEIKPFLGIHALRGLLVLMAAATLQGSSSPVEFCLLVPFLVESALYLPTVLALGGGLGLLVVLGVIDGLGLAAVGGAPAAHLVLVGLVGLTVLLASVVGVFYRNQVVRERGTVAQLNRDVDSLIRANQAFQDYADTIEAVTEETERNRITRELHDVIGYALTNIVMMMNAARVLSRDQPDKLDELLTQTRTHADEALQESRRILYTLRAITPTARKGLNAIHHLAQTFQAATETSVEVAYGNVPQSLGIDIDAALFRLVQEGMTNALRHGQATKIRISFWREPDLVQVIVWDNGKGGKAVSEGIGLAGMRERFGALGGAVLATSVTDGFELTGTIPIAQEWTHEQP